MSRVTISQGWRTLLGDPGPVVADGGDVAAVLQALVAHHPLLAPRIFDQSGQIHSFVNVYLGHDDVRHLPAGLATHCPPNSELVVVPALAGG